MIYKYIRLKLPYLEYEEGINAVAAPIFGRDGSPLASVAVAGPSYRLQKDRMKEIGTALLVVADEISKRVDLSSDD